MYLSTEPEVVNRLIKPEETSIFDKTELSTLDIDEDLTDLDEVHRKDK